MYEFVTYVHVVSIFMYFLSFNLQKLRRNYAAGVFGVLCRLFWGDLQLSQGFSSTCSATPPKTNTSSFMVDF